MGNTGIRTLFSILLSVAAAQSSAQDDPVAGRMLCHVTGSQYVTPSDARVTRSNKRTDGFSTGTSYLFEYALDEIGGLVVFFGDQSREEILIYDPFSNKGFKGLSPFIGIAEFETNYRNLSFGHFQINYSGEDQLYLKRCSGNDWTGHYVQHYFGGHFSQVATLNCRPEIDSVDEILARIKALK